MSSRRPFRPHEPRSCVDGAAQGARVDRLDQLARRRRRAWPGSGRPPGRGATGSTCRGCGRPIPRAAGRWRTAIPPMLPICMSRTTRSGLLLAHDVAHVLAPGDLDDPLAPCGARGLHQVADPLGVGGDEDRAHGGNASRHPVRWLPDRAERGEVVDVVAELGDVGHRGVADPMLEAGELGDARAPRPPRGRPRLAYCAASRPDAVAATRSRARGPGRGATSGSASQ